jgi:hypothetical protein
MVWLAKAGALRWQILNPKPGSDWVISAAVMGDSDSIVLGLGLTRIIGGRYKALIDKY